MQLHVNLVSCETLGFGGWIWGISPVAANAALDFFWKPGPSVPRKTPAAPPGGGYAYSELLVY